MNCLRCRKKVWIGKDGSRNCARCGLLWNTEIFGEDSGTDYWDKDEWKVVPCGCLWVFGVTEV